MMLFSNVFHYEAAHVFEYQHIKTARQNIASSQNIRNMPIKHHLR